MTKKDLAKIYAYFHNAVGEQCHDRAQVQTQCQAAAMLTELFLKYGGDDE